MSKPVVACVAAILVAAALTACGGSDPTTATSTTAESTESGGSGAGGNGGANGSSGAHKAKPGGKPSGGGNGGESKALAAPLRVSGGGSGQYRTKGGDNSVQNFGEESGESELQEAAEALHGFYVARAEGDWASACGYLEKSVTSQLEQLAAQSPQLKGKGCTAALRAFTRTLPAAAMRETTVVDAGSLRREGERAFLIYRAVGKTVYAMPMQEEGGAWKVGLLAATPLN